MYITKKLALFYQLYLSNYNYTDNYIKPYVITIILKCLLNSQMTIARNFSVARFTEISAQLLNALFEYQAPGNKSFTAQYAALCQPCRCALLRSFSARLAGLRVGFTSPRLPAAVQIQVITVVLTPAALSGTPRGRRSGHIRPQSGTAPFSSLQSVCLRWSYLAFPTTNCTGRSKLR